MVEFLATIFFLYANSVRIYNTSFQQVAFIQNNQVTEAAVTFTCATVINGIVYMGQMKVVYLHL
jgi:hypothetical protein